MLHLLKKKVLKNMLKEILICMLLTLKKTTTKKPVADTHNQEVVSSLPIGKRLAKMAEKVKQTLTVRFNTAYYLAKNECLHSEFVGLLTLQEKNGVKTSDIYCNERAGASFIHTTGTSICQILLEDIEKYNYFTLLMD